MPRKLTGTLEKASASGRSSPVRNDACPACGSIMQEVIAELDFPVNSEEVTVPDISHLRCPACNEVMLRLDEARVLRERAFALYQKKYGLLTADEIRRIRERLGITQARLAALLRLGANTISRWEAGRTIQTTSMDLMLRMVRDVPGVPDYLQRLCSPALEIALPSSKRKFDTQASYATLIILALLSENGGVCSQRRVRMACVLLSSKDRLLQLAPPGMKRIVKQWVKQLEEPIQLTVWKVAIDELLNRQVISRDVTQGELTFRINQGNMQLDALSSDEWLSFEVRSVLKIIDSNAPDLYEQLEQALPPQEREKIKVAS